MQKVQTHGKFSQDQSPDCRTINANRNRMSTDILMNVVIIPWNHIYHIMRLEKQVTINLCLSPKYGISYWTINIKIADKIYAHSIMRSLLSEVIVLVSFVNVDKIKVLCCVHERLWVPPLSCLIYASIFIQYEYRPSVFKGVSLINKFVSAWHFFLSNKLYLFIY